jgi:hypothetical protein
MLSEPNQETKEEIIGSLLEKLQNREKQLRDVTTALAEASDQICFVKKGFEK